MRRGVAVAMAALWLVMGWLTACNGINNDYSEYHRLPEGGWRYADTLVFMPVHADSVCGGRFVVALSHDSNYPYEDLWLEVKSAEGEANRPVTDTLHLTLADGYGNWTGRGIGPTFQLSDTLPERVHRSGAPVKVRHIMRVDTLRGINQVGVFFVP